MPINEDEVMAYMKGWYDDEKPTDFVVAFDKGYYDLCVYYLCSAGAIEPICAASRKMLRDYEKMEWKDIKKQMDECFKHCVTMINEHDEIIFVPVDDPDLDYFVSVEEWEEDGYREIEDAKGTG